MTDEVPKKILLNASRSRKGWSFYASLLHCAQKWGWEQMYARGETPGSSAVNLGSCLHIALAHHYLRKQKPQDAGRYHTPEEALRILAVRLQVTPEETDSMLEVWKRYGLKYTSDPLWQVLAVEQEFDATIHGELITQRQDLVVRDLRDNKVYIVDHKSSSTVTKALEDRYTNSGQFHLAHLLGMANYGAEFGGILINVLSSQMLTPKGKPPTAAFMRFKLPPALDMWDTFPADIQFANGLIQLLKDRPLDRYPRARNEQICMTKYGVCKWFRKCKDGKDTP